MTLYTLQLTIRSFGDHRTTRYTYVFTSPKERDDFYTRNGESLAMHYLYEDEDDPDNYVDWDEGQVTANSAFPIGHTHHKVRYVTEKGYKTQLDEAPRMARIYGADFTKEFMMQFTVLPYKTDEN